ncbi:MAG: hypothetical protein WCR67_02985 [Bacilli bacterium]
MRNRLIAFMKSLTISAVLVFLSLLLGLITLIIFIWYSTINAIISIPVLVFLPIALIASLTVLIFNKKWTPYLSILIPVFFTVSLCEELHSGIGNIVDALQGIAMFGNSALAPINYLMTILLFLCLVLSLVSCFIRKPNVTNVTSLEN